MMGKSRPKHVELTWNNKLIYMVHQVGYFHSITMKGFMYVKFIFVSFPFGVQLAFTSLLSRNSYFTLQVHISEL
jgi:hypothetical protein